MTHLKHDYFGILFITNLLLLYYYYIITYY